MNILNANILNEDGFKKINLSIKNGVVEDISSISKPSEALDLNGAILLKSNSGFLNKLNKLDNKALKNLSERARAGGVGNLIINSKSLNGSLGFSNLNMANDLDSFGGTTFGGLINPSYEDGISDIAILKASGGVGIAVGAGIPTEKLKILHQYATRLNIPIIANAYDKSLGGLLNEGQLSYKMGLAPTPSYAQSIEIAREIELSKSLKSKLIFTNTNKLISGYCSIIDISYLLYSEEMVEGYNTQYKMLPPLLNLGEKKSLISEVFNDKNAIISPAFSDFSTTSKDMTFNDAIEGINTLENFTQLAYFDLLKALLNITEFNPSIITSKIFATNFALLASKIGRDLRNIDEINTTINIGDKANFIALKYENDKLEIRNIG